MGFYAPAQLVIDAEQHGVEFRPMDVNLSSWKYTLEEKRKKYCFVRMGFRQVSGIKEDEIVLLIARRHQPYTNIQAMQEARVAVSTLEKLADADAFRSTGLGRRKALWMVTGLAKDATGRQRDKKGAIKITQQLDLFTSSPTHSLIEEGVQLTEMNDPEHFVYDYQSLSLKGHPISFLRKNLEALNNIPAKQLPTRRNGEFIRVAGRILVRQRPGTPRAPASSPSKTKPAP